MGGTDLKANIKYLCQDRDRHGNLRTYVRVPGKPKVRLRDPIGSREFWIAYNEAVNPERKAAKPRKRQSEAKANSLRALCKGYYRSSEFNGHASTTRRPRKALLEDICASKAPNGTHRGDLLWHEMRIRDIRIIRDEHMDRPEAANGRIKALRQLFAWAIEADIAESNPAKGVKYLRGKSQGFHTWSADEVRQFEARHPVGTKARLALDLLLCTGTRRSDAVRLGPQMERQGRLHFTETKGGHVKKRAIPMLPRLRSSIEATPSGHMAFLVTEKGKPYSAAGFGNWFRRRCDEAGLPHCSAHGLRKAGATIAAENGATGHELMALFGWDTQKQAEIYTREADRQRLADQAMHLVLPTEEGQKGNKIVPLSGDAKKWDKKGQKSQ